MLALLARDDPPTTASDELLARLSSAGVDLIEPLLRVLSKDQVELAEDAGEAVNAIAIYVAGPGLVLPVALKDEPAPAAAALERILYHVERFDQLRRFRLAADDMRLVEKTAQQLRDRDGDARLFEQVLERGSSSLTPGLT